MLLPESLISSSCASDFGLALSAVYGRRERAGFDPGIARCEDRADGIPSMHCNIFFHCSQSVQAVCEEVWKVRP